MPRRTSGKSLVNAEAAAKDTNVILAVERGIIEFDNNRVAYHLRRKKTYVWTDPEEWVRCRTIAFLTMQRNYPANRLDTEVLVPRRTPNDWADIVVYSDDRCQQPYLIVENKPDGQTQSSRQQAIEQAFGNANSLRAPLALYDEGSTSTFYDVANFPPTKRKNNIKGSRDAIPNEYGNVPAYTYVAGSSVDIVAVKSNVLESRIRRVHWLIWAGGKRDPLTAFDEWSKLLFAKVLDEKGTPTNQARGFQIGTNETSASVAGRIHDLFRRACKRDPSIFPEGTKIDLSDTKIYDIVGNLQDISCITRFLG